MNKSFWILYSALNLAVGCSYAGQENELSSQIDGRTYPSTFMAWYNIDMPEVPLDTEENRLKACAMHDLMWEEPLSQKGEGRKLVLDLEWEGDYPGLSTSFTSKSLARARRNRERLRELNPNMVCLCEVRWRDAPKSFLPDDSPYWMRQEDGSIVEGWKGGFEPFYMLDYRNQEFVANIAEQAHAIVSSGVYDGIMLDWSGNLEVVKMVRKAIGDDKLLIVNIHDDIEDAIKYKDYINGSFMELNPVDSLSMSVDGLKLYSNDDVNKRNWKKIEEALRFFEMNLLKPTINCLEVWGNRKDLARMRATTTLGLTMGNGYVLYSDPNPLPTPDHMHDWYPFYNRSLGRPEGSGCEQPDGSWKRVFDNGVVVYNPYGNNEVEVVFDNDVQRASDGQCGTSFRIQQRDGDIFLFLK